MVFGAGGEANLLRLGFGAIENGIVSLDCEGILAAGYHVGTCFGVGVFSDVCWQVVLPDKFGQMFRVAGVLAGFVVVEIKDFSEAGCNRSDADHNV